MSKFLGFKFLNCVRNSPLRRTLFCSHFRPIYTKNISIIQKNSSLKIFFICEKNASTFVDSRPEIGYDSPWSLNSVPPSTNEFGPVFELAPLDAENLIIFDRLLRFLREDIEFTKTAFLLKAPYFANRVDVDRRKMFVDLIGKWWLQTEKYFSVGEFKVSSAIFHLSELNALSQGAVLKKLGGERILDYFLGRWLDVGLDQFLFGDVLSGLTGLRKFLICNVSKMPVVDKKALTRWNDFVAALETYIVKKGGETEGDELKWIVENEAGSGCLSLLRQLLIVPSTETLRCLNEWSLISFRKYIDRPDEIKVTNRNLGSYSDAWLCFGINPDSLTPDSLATWFKAYSLNLSRTNDSKNLSSHSLGDVVGLVLRFDCTDSFSQIYDVWHEAVLTVLRRGDGRNVNVNKLASTLFAIGRMADEKHLSNDIRSKLDSLAGELLNRIIGGDPATMSIRALSMAMSGFRKTSASASKDSGDSKNEKRKTYSKNVSLFLQKRLIITRQRENERSTAALDWSGICFGFVRGELIAPEFLLDELTHTYFWGLSRADKSLIVALWTYATTCCRLFYDPSKNSAVGTRAWPTWYRYARQSLGVGQGLNEQRKSNLRLLLAVMEVTTTFQRVDDFRGLQSIWEKRLIDDLPFMQKKDLFFLCKRIKEIENGYDIKFDPKIVQHYEAVKDIEQRK